MPVSYLDIAGTYTGPGAYNYNVASYPGGAVLFVNSASGLDNRGRVTFMGTPSSVGAQPLSAQGPFGDPNKPLASVFGPNGALSFCKAGRGDTIVVAPGHAESLATGAVITVPDSVNIIGSGYGNSRPTFTVTVLGTYITFGGCAQLQNLIFNLTGVAALVKGFLVNTSGVQFVLGKIIQASGTNQCTDAIVLNTGGDDFLFNNSEIDATAAAVTGHGISNPTTNNINRLVIVNSYLHGSWTLGAISILSTASVEFIIEYNTLRNYNATGVFPLFLATGNTILGFIAYNDVMMAGTAATTICSGGTGTGLCFIQNFMWDTKAAASGILAPAAGTP